MENNQKWIWWRGVNRFFAFIKYMQIISCTTHWNIKTTILTWRHKLNDKHIQMRKAEIPLSFLKQRGKWQKQKAQQCSLDCYQTDKLKNTIHPSNIGAAKIFIKRVFWKGRGREGKSIKQPLLFWFLLIPCFVLNKNGRLYSCVEDLNFSIFIMWYVNKTYNIIKITKKGVSLLLLE